MILLPFQILDITKSHLRQKPFTAYSAKGSMPVNGFVYIFSGMTIGTAMACCAVLCCAVLCCAVTSTSRTGIIVKPLSCRNFGAFRSRICIKSLYHNSTEKSSERQKISVRKNPTLITSFKPLIRFAPQIQKCSCELFRLPVQQSASRF